MVEEASKEGQSELNEDEQTKAAKTLSDKREAEKDKKNPAQEAAEKAETAVKGVKRAQNILKWVKIGTAVTVVGIIITIIIMNVQLFAGNIMKIRLVPELSPLEILIIAILDLIIFFLVLAVVVIIFLVSNPRELLKLFPLIEVLKLFVQYYFK